MSDITNHRRFGRASGAIASAALAASSATGQLPVCESVAPQIGMGGIVARAGAVADFNGDGFMDIFAVTGDDSGPDRLFLNNGDGTFTAANAPWTETHWGVGAAAADYDDDGDVDIFVSSLGVVPTEIIGNHKLYRNNGDGTFTNVAAQAGVSTTSTSRADASGAAFGDYDLDGDLDLFVGGYYPPRQGNRLFRNNGDGTFADVSASAGLLPGLHSSWVFGPRFADMNGDRYPELLIAGDYFTSRYLVNNGDGTFTDQTASSGTGLDANGMGHTIADYNGDGLMDWYVTSIFTRHPLGPVPGTGNMLYVNNGDDTFTEVSAAARVKEAGWGWGTDSIDFNHDGRIDIVATNGSLGINGQFLQEWAADPTRAYRNNGDGTFTDVGPTLGIGSHTGLGLGLVTLDLENDGDMDTVIFNVGGQPLTVFRSNAADGLSLPWLRVFLDASAGDDLAPQGFGSRIVATIDGGGGGVGGVGGQHRVICPGSTFMSQSEPAVHFGLGGRIAVDELRVEWTNGRTTRVANVAGNRHLMFVYQLADGDGNGRVDIFDLLHFLDGFFAGDADFDADGGTDVFDLLAYLDAFFAEHGRSAVRELP